MKDKIIKILENDPDWQDTDFEYSLAEEAISLTLKEVKNLIEEEYKKTTYKSAMTKIFTEELLKKLDD